LRTSLELSLLPKDDQQFLLASIDRVTMAFASLSKEVEKKIEQTKSKSAQQAARMRGPDEGL
jgi:hypothetical protein